MSKKGAGVLLVYEPPRSQERLKLELGPAKLKEVKALAASGDPARLRDLLLGEGPRIDLLTNAALSSVISANTWRWALPLFGGPQPARRTGRGPRFGRRSKG